MLLVVATIVSSGTGSGAVGWSATRRPAERDHREETCHRNGRAA